MHRNRKRLELKKEKRERKNLRWWNCWEYDWSSAIKISGPQLSNCFLVLLMQCVMLYTIIPYVKSFQVNTIIHEHYSKSNGYKLKFINGLCSEWYCLCICIWTHCPAYLTSFSGWKQYRHSFRVNFLFVLFYLCISEAYMVSLLIISASKM